MKELQRFMAPMVERVRGMIARATVSAVDDGTEAQSMQLELLADETADEVERFAEYGFTSVPHPGAEALVAFVGGLRSHGVVVAVEDRRYRLTGLEAGEVALFDDQGQVIKLGRAGIEVTTDKPIVVTAERLTVEAEAIELGGAGGQPVARVGDQVDLSSGKIVSGSDVVTAS